MALLRPGFPPPPGGAGGATPPAGAGSPPPGPYGGPAWRPPASITPPNIGNLGHPGHPSSFYTGQVSSNPGDLQGQPFGTNFAAYYNPGSTGAAGAATGGATMNAAGATNDFGLPVVVTPHGQGWHIQGTTANHLQLVNHLAGNGGPTNIGGGVPSSPPSWWPAGAPWPPPVPWRTGGGDPYGPPQQAPPPPRNWFPPPGGDPYGPPVQPPAGLRAWLSQLGL